MGPFWGFGLLFAILMIYFGWEDARNEKASSWTVVAISLSRCVWERFVVVIIIRHYMYWLLGDKMGFCLDTISQIAAMGWKGTGEATPSWKDPIFADRVTFRFVFLFCWWYINQIPKRNFTWYLITLYKLLLLPREYYGIQSFSLSSVSFVLYALIKSSHKILGQTKRISIYMGVFLFSLMIIYW